MKTAHRYDTKLPCPACGHMQSQTDKAKLYLYSVYRIAWGDIESEDDWAKDYMPFCNGCGCRLEVGKKVVKRLTKAWWDDKEVTHRYNEYHWYWIARLI